MATNMKENGFETMIVKYLVENNHYEEGSNSDYNKIYAIDEVRLFRFLHDTQYTKAFIILSRQWKMILCLIKNRHREYYVIM